MSTAPLVINSSLVFFDFKTPYKEIDSFSGAYRFHSTLLFGIPSPNTTCDTIIRGDEFSFLPKRRGLISSPSPSPLLYGWAGPLSCSTTLLPGPHQSLLFTLATSSLPSSSTCRTGCNGTGCSCHSPQTLEREDHILITSPQGRFDNHIIINFILFQNSRMFLWSYG